MVGDPLDGEGHPEEGGVMGHAGAFVAGWVVALGGDVAVLAGVVWHASGGMPGWRDEFARAAVTGLVGFACSVGMATAHLLSRLCESQERARFQVNRRYWRTMAVGLGHGVIGVWPVFLAAEWWGERRMSPGAYGLMEMAGLLWFAGGVLAAGRVAARLARGGPVVAGRRRRCRACGYDLRASAGRCPECGTAVVGDGAVGGGEEGFQI